MIKILHTGDIHVCEKHHAWIDKALSFMVNRARQENIDAWVIAGDSFDSAISVHSPAYTMFVKHVMALSDIAPGVLLYGTPLHDRPGVLDPFKHMPTKYPIYVADEPEQILLQAGEWYQGGEITANTCEDGDALFSFLPSLNRAHPKVMEVGANKYAADILASFSEKNQVARDAGIATVLTSHGMVIGSETESGYAIISPDHEFTEEALFSADADAAMLGHVHKTQQWDRYYTGQSPQLLPCRQTIAYCGSLARLVHGDHEPKGFLVWNIEAGNPGYKHIKTPTRQLLEIEFNGPPDMVELSDLAARADADTEVRVRWSIDQEHAHSVDKQAIRAMFSHAAGVKLEGTVNSVQSVRAAGIGKAMSLHEKLGYYVKTTGDEDKLSDLTLRLGMVQTMEADEIAEGIKDGQTTIEPE